MISETTPEDWVWQHRTADPYQLTLSGKFPHGAQPGEWAAQVGALQKIKHKIPTWYQPGLRFPTALSIEQSSSEATARYKAGLFSGTSVADLTGGMGADSFFFAQNFQKVVYVERNTALLAIVQHNFGVLKTDNVTFVAADAADFLSGTTQQFDLVFIDPARRDDRKGRVFLLEDCTPDILQLKDTIFEKTSKILLKAAPMLDIKLAIRQLGCVTKVWVVASEGECREVLFLLERNALLSEDQVPICAVSLHQKANPRTFNFTFLSESQSIASYSPPLRYLYEPDPAILKAGAFRSFAVQNGLKKLQVNTHLYTADTFTEHLPARSFAIEAVSAYHRKDLQLLLPGGKANVTVRNFPDTAEQVQKKMGLSNGGDRYIFAATLEDNRKVLILCKAEKP